MVLRGALRPGPQTTQTACGDPTPQCSNGRASQFAYFGPGQATQPVRIPDRVGSQAAADCRARAAFCSAADDVGFFPAGVRSVLRRQGNAALCNCSWQVNPDGTIPTGVTVVPDLRQRVPFNYPTTAGGDGTNHFTGGGGKHRQASDLPALRPRTPPIPLQTGYACRAHLTPARQSRLVCHWLRHYTYCSGWGADLYPGR